MEEMENTNGLGAVTAQVERLVIDALDSEIMECPQEPRGYYLIGPKGEAKLVRPEPGWHKEGFDRPEELRRFILEQSADKDGILIPCDFAAVFVTPERIILVHDLKDRRNISICPLQISPQYNWLLQNGGKQMSQTSIVRELRITFRNCLQSENLLGLLRSLKFNTDLSGNADLQHGRESMGKSVLAKVTGVDALPEETDLMMPVFNNHGKKTGIKCAIEVFPAEQTFAITPYPQELTRAMDDAVADLIMMFTDNDLPPCYRGTPNFKS